MRLRLPKTRSMRRAEAARWFARLRGEPTEQQRREFERWYAADPLNAAAYERMSDTFQSTGLLRQSQIDWSAEERARELEREPRPRFALAALVAAVLLMPVAFVAWRVATHERSNAVMLATGSAEIRTVALTDGTRVTLDRSTRVAIELDQRHRRARLLVGRARFAVQGSTPSFTVEAGKLIVDSNGGAEFDVARSGESASVEVRAGLTEVQQRDGGRTPTILEKGQGYTVSPSGSRRLPLSPGPDWTEAMLQFDATPISEVIAQANLHDHRPIRLTSTAPNLRVSGAFRIGDNEALAHSLAEVFGLRLIEQEDAFLLATIQPKVSQKKNGG